MCNLYSMTSTQQAIRDLARAWKDSAGNVSPLPGVFPDYRAPIVRNQPEGRELVMARWGMPSPVFALKGRNSDPGVTNVRNTASLYRTRLSGHAVALCGAPEGGVEVRGASVERAEVAVLLDQPLGVVAGGEVADGVADLIDGLEDAAVDGLLL
ncbi:MAG: hypothetical protein O9325_20810, partial [Roseomonas sp.]|nr:hypothetical protein [Roseomonas sp.]